MKYLNLKERKKLCIQLPDDEEIILIRRLIPASESENYEKKLNEIQTDFLAKKFNLAEFSFRMLEQICDNFEREKFKDVDAFFLKDIIAAFTDMDKEQRKPGEKKSE